MKVQMVLDTGPLSSVAPTNLIHEEAYQLTQEFL